MEKKIKNILGRHVDSLTILQNRDGNGAGTPQSPRGIPAAGTGMGKLNGDGDGDGGQSDSPCRNGDGDGESSPHPVPRPAPPPLGKPAGIPDGEYETPLLFISYLSLKKYSFIVKLLPYNLHL